MIEPVPVSFAEGEHALAAGLGALRRYRAVRGRFAETGGGTLEPWESNIEGLGYELAVCHLLNVYPRCLWAVNDKQDGDLTYRDVLLDVKGSKFPWNRPDWCMLVPPAGPDDRVYVGVAGVMPHYMVMGAMCGWRVKSYPLGFDGEKHMVPKRELVSVDDAIEQYFGRDDSHIDFGQ